MSFIDALLNAGMRARLRGAVRLLRLVRGANPVPLTRTRTKHGLTIWIDPTSYMDQRVLDTGYFDEEVLDAVMAQLGENEVLWDIGANIGLHAITAKHLRPSARVVAFEPVPLMVSRAITNAEINGLAVEIMPFALGATAGYFPLNVQISSNSGLSTFKPSAGIHYESRLTVRVDRADAMFELVPPPNVIKIDVEGFEADVFDGFGPALSHVKAVIFEEFEGERAASAILKRLGFSIAPLSPPGGGPVTNFVATRTVSADA